MIPLPHAHGSCNSPTLSRNDERCMLGAKTLPQMFGLTSLSPSCNQVCGCACGKRWAQTHGETSEIRDVILQGIASRNIPRNFLREIGRVMRRQDRQCFFSDHVVVRSSIRAVAPHGEQFADVACQSISKCHVHLWDGMVLHARGNSSAVSDLTQTQLHRTDEAEKLLLETSQGEPIDHHTYFGNKQHR